MNSLQNPIVQPTAQLNRGAAVPPPMMLAGRLLALVSGAYVCVRVAVDPDLWGHLKFGWDLLQTRRLIPVDRYSFTADAPWIDHEWLGEIVQAAAFHAGGVIGLVLLKAAIVGAAFALMAWATKRAAGPARWWLLAAGIIALTPIAFNVRPQLWTILGVAIVWRALNDRGWLLTLPVVFMLWANLHGGWLLGAGLAGLFLVGRVLDTRSFSSVVRPGIVLAVSMAATIVNPYGLRLWEILATTAGPARNIGEWRPLWEQHEPSFFALWLLIAIGVVATTAIRKPRGMTFAAALPVAWLGVNSLLVTRIAPFFGEVAAMAFASAWAGAAEARTSTKRAPAAANFWVIDAVAIAAVVLPSLFTESRCLAVQDDWQPDFAAAGAFEDASVRGRLVLPIDWGEYAIWHWGPRLLVSIDGRLGATTKSDTVYSEDVIRTQAAVSTGQPEGLAFLQRERPEYVWLKRPAGERAMAWLAANGYAIDVMTAASFVARRSDLPQLKAAAPMTACFP